jgi:3-phenylpropionate/trans-cinnamate dioxygenase ferredoxin subunit
MATIKIQRDGPYMVEGDVKLMDHEGKEVKPAKQPFFLCRCGGSVKKPFCDGTHSKIGFKGAREAVEGSGI